MVHSYVKMGTIRVPEGHNLLQLQTSHQHEPMEDSTQLLKNLILENEIKYI